MFNSQHVNNDPNPYVWAQHSPIDKARTDTEMFRKGGNAEMVKHFGYEYAPRPEYDNSPNPLLETIRENLTEATLHSWMDWLEDFEPEMWTECEPEHIDHARKVLTRLVNIHGDS